MDDRGATGPLGVILVFGISLAAVVGIVAIGAGAIGDAGNDAETAQIENSMSQFSSKASLVGLGGSSNQRFALGRASSGDVDVRGDAGRVEIRVDSGSVNGTIYNETYGAVVYRNGDTEVAYQGGGVWRKDGGASRMVSPPEYHYRDLTLTFPVIRVDGSGSVSGRPTGTITSETVDEPIYPDPTNSSLNNPLANGSVFVTVESEYCAGWEAFFRDRSDGSIEESCDEGEQGAVVVDLSIQFGLSFNNALEADTITVNGNEDPPDDSVEGVNRPSPSEEVEKRIDDCESGSSCDPLDNNSDISSGGTYYADNNVEFGDVEYDTSGGDIDLVIDGDIKGADEINVTGDNNVTVYLRGKFEMGGGDRINTGGDASQFVTIIHSDSPEIDFDGNYQYTGAIYAPTTDADTNGGGNPDKNFIGALIVNDADINGNPNNFKYDPDLEGYELPIPSDVTPITYLHVTENTVEVELN